MEYRELDLKQSLEITSPTIICDLGNTSSTCKVLQQIFDWTLNGLKGIKPTVVQKYKCRSPTFSVNFGGIVFDNAELILYPFGSNRRVVNDQLEFLLHVPNICSQYLAVTNAIVTFSILYRPTPVTKDIAIDMHSFSVDQCLGVSISNVNINEDTVHMRCSIKTLLMQPATIPLTLQADMGKFYKTQEMSDVTFIIDNKKLPAHKCILAARSPVFKAMFETQMKEATENVVEITDVDYDTFDRFLQFVYAGEIVDTKKFAENLLGLSDKYNMNDLKVVCEKRLAANLTIENATQMFNKADLYNAQVLKKAAIVFLSRNM